MTRIAEAALATVTAREACVAQSLQLLVQLPQHSVLLCFILHFSIIDRSKMPLGEDGHSWKKKTSSIKEIYDFKEVLGTLPLFDFKLQWTLTALRDVTQLLIKPHRPKQTL
ncbi:hypothetical protein DPX16_5644 [Anabarilius grahami]|uniref:Uncharacterized protein n=1 Tax=Anabarilius grahami TaxID=495550 RepID=A0A3N0YQI9_ANAGA|nr:hypothetical protein DPX16_5644 [Anabarilius grahami]